MSKLLIIGYVWPEPTSSAAGKHMMDIIQPFHQSGWDITFATPAADSTNKFDLSSWGIHEKDIELNATSFDQWLVTLQPDVVIFDRFMMEEQFGWRVGKACPKALKVLDTEDLHFLRQARQENSFQHDSLQRDSQQYFGIINNVEDVDIITDNTLRELASIYRCDLTLIISQEEMCLLDKQFSINQSLLLYYPLLVHDLPENQLAFEQRKDFIFVGTMKHAPNLDAVRRLKKDLWPKIKERLPGENLYIVGSYMTEEVIQMHKPKQGFHVLGHVEDLESLLKKMRLMLAPLAFGAGIKGKLTEAMQYGLPSITTKIGAEGITDKDSWPGRVEDSNAEFINSAVSLYNDMSNWPLAQQRGVEVLKSKFLYADHAESFLSRIESLRENLDQHRKANFIGQMLNMNNMKSTEYMSRWIECKNKNSRNSGSA